MLDVDGVLVTAAAPPGFAYDNRLEDGVAAVHRGITGPEWELLATGRAELAPMVEAILRGAGSSVEAAELIDYWFRRETRIHADVLAGAAALRAGGMRVYLATNQDNARAAYLMETAGLGAHVDGILHSAALGYRKPSPGYFIAATTRAGVPPDEIVFIDDNPLNVEAARAAGWRATHWRGDMSLRAAVDVAR